MRAIIGFAIGLLSIQAAIVMTAGNALADEITMPYFEDFEDINESIVGEWSWSNYRFEVDIATHGSTDQLITFGWNPAGDNYRLNIRPDPWNDVVFSKVVNQEREDLVHLQGLPNQHHQWHHVAVLLPGKMHISTM